MLVYRARLDGQVADVLAITVHPRPAAPRLGRDQSAAVFRVTVRYVKQDGMIGKHQGTLHAYLPAGRELVVAGYQLSGGELLITLRPVAPSSRTGRGVALADQFHLPIRLQAWGVTAVLGARIDLQAVCRQQGQAVAVRGVVLLTLHTAGAPFHLRIAFLRLIGAEREGDLVWRVLAGVTGLHLRVEPGGLIEGELVVVLRCEGRPAERREPAPTAQLRLVKELLGAVSRVQAEHSGAGHALVQGTIDLDLYWIDQQGRGRWTGQPVPFSAVLPVDGLEPQDDLEARAEVQRLAHRIDGRHVAVHLLLTLSVTALRRMDVMVGSNQYRLDQVVGRSTTTVALEELLLTESKPATMGLQIVGASLPLAGPASGWQEVAAILSAPDVGTAAGSGRWRVRGSLGGTPAGDSPYPAPLKAATGGTARLGVNDVLTVVPGLSAIDEAGVHLRTTLAWGLAIPAATPILPTGTVQGEIVLPGPVRSVLGVEIAREGSLTVRALVALEPRGLALVHGLVADQPTAGVPLSVTVVPLLYSGQWRLCVTIDITRGQA